MSELPIKNSLSRQRIFGLDLVRATAIFLVLTDHSRFFFSPLNQRTNVLAICGFWGVELFFVLSGFLIGGILIRKYFHDGQFSLKGILHFWKRRWFRTLPNYFLVLMISAWVYRDLIDEKPAMFVSYLFFVQNLTGEIPPFFRESWSLSIEEWFYLILPFLFLMVNLVRNKRHLLLTMILAMILGFSLVRFFNTRLAPAEAWNTVVRQVVILRLDAVGYGVLLAYFYHFHQVLLEKYKGLMGMVGLLLLVLTAYWYYSMVYNQLDSFIANNVIFAAVSISFALMFPKVISIDSHRVKWLVRPVTQISLISYSMYLVNYGLILVPLMTYYVADSWGKASVFLLLFWVLTITLAYVLYRFYERPMMDLRERTFFFNYNRK